jgi:flagellin-like protein
MLNLEIKKIKRIKRNEIGVSPVIAVILMVAITVVLAGVLWAALSRIAPDDAESINITIRNPVEKSYGWFLEISDVSSSLNLEDAKFQVVDNEGALEYSVTIIDTNPTPFLKSKTTVYAMTKSNSPVKDDTNNTIDGFDAISVYSGCYIAYLDQNSDGKVTAGDSIYVFKDYNTDSIEDIKSNYQLKIIKGDVMAGSKTL